MRAFSVLSLICILFSCLPHQAQAGEEKVLIWRLRSLGVDKEIGSRVEELLAKEMERLPGIALISAQELARVVEQTPDLGRCSGQPECLIALGRATGSALVVSGVLGKLGDSFSLDLKLVDPGAGRETGRLAQTWDGSDDTLIEVMRQVATRALRPASFLGRLVLTTNVEQVQVFIDGDLVGRTPLSEPVGLAPGRHALKLVRNGFHDHERFIDLVFDRDLPLHIQLQDAVVREVVVTRQAPDWLGLGLKGGVLANWNELVAPQVALDVQVRLPFWDGRLAVQLSTAAYGTQLEGQTVAGDRSSLAVEGDLLVWPSSLGLVLRMTPERDLSPYLAAGGSFVLIWQTLSPDGYGQQTYRDPAWGFVVSGGLDYRVGPGVVLVDLGYRHLSLADEGRGGFSGLLGGLSLQAGYRIWL